MMENKPQTTQERIDALIVPSLTTHFGTAPRAAMRCGLSDASAICDILERDFLAEYTTKSGYIKKRGRELAAIAKRCGDQIWAYRESVNVE